MIFKALDAKKDKTIVTNQIWIRNKHVRGIFAKIQIYRLSEFCKDCDSKPAYNRNE